MPGMKKSNTRKNLPSLQTLVAFEATVKTGSMTAAGRALNMTQSAVSQRIRLLEEHTGLVLFDRSSGRLQTTHVGEQLYADVRDILERLDTTLARYRDMADPGRKQVTIAANFGFAHLWLLPRMDALEAAFPLLDVQITAIDHDEPSATANADLAIRFGQAPQNDPQVVQLTHERVSLVCSPAFALQHGLSQNVRKTDLAQLPLLHMDQADPRWLDWQQWADRNHLDVKIKAPRIQYNNYPLLLAAAKEGQGLALGWAELTSTAVHQGSLVRIGPTVERLGFGYLCQTRYRDHGVIASVIDWLVQSLAQDGHARR